MDEETKLLLNRHDQMLKYWKRKAIGGPEPCGECGAEVEVWWQYCSTCGKSVNA